MLPVRDDYGDAVLSDDGRYRYELRRVWDLETPLCKWIIVVALSARRAPEPVGPRNDHHIATMATLSISVICAWGTRVEALLHQAAPRLRLHCVAKTDTGAPRHPLFVPATATPIPLRAVTE